MIVGMLEHIEGITCSRSAESWVAKGETLREWEVELKQMELQLKLKETSLSELLE